jgi:hypothetical protein
MYFPRMLDKIRLHAEARLRADFHSNIGRGMDGWCCDFLRVAYTDLRTRTLSGGTDEEILNWCQEKGRRLDRTDLLVWNHFVSKFGWNDVATPLLKKLKNDSGFGDRDEIVTMFEYFEVDEGRKS